MSYGITQFYLPPDRGDVPAITPTEVGTRFAVPLKEAVIRALPIWPLTPLHCSVHHAFHIQSNSTPHLVHFAPLAQISTPSLAEVFSLQASCFILLRQQSGLIFLEISALHTHTIPFCAANAQPGVKLRALAMACRSAKLPIGLPKGSLLMLLLLRTLWGASLAPTDYILMLNFPSGVTKC